MHPRPPRSCTSSLSASGVPYAPGLTGSADYFKRMVGAELDKLEL